MKFTWIALPGVLLLSACSSSQPNAPSPARIGMPNPAAVYCEQQGGTLMPVQTPQGVRSDCKLPNGEILDEWTLWRRDHPDTKK
ncbi:DUF333 domain-containing protein [Salmonella enterica]|nr:DUF333 domain-containing protein [Salmonella enterica]EBE4964541.1 DUF333 domain-containing protein [Salmonella enterica]EBT5331695.1 DUF333 domain-containing protein [Salmonella enterica]ECH4619023.1 DUF333 domain-containing protein [Salmonella enterica]EGG9186683.1 DUF333 domain-containing protein [Salmonella enterica]